VQYAARPQQKQQRVVAAEESSVSMLDGGSSKSWGTAAAAKPKRGGYKVGALKLLRGSCCVDVRYTVSIHCSQTHAAPGNCRTAACMLQVINTLCLPPLPVGCDAH
jgi:hypothetical protein